MRQSVHSLGFAAEFFLSNGVFDVVELLNLFQRLGGALRIGVLRFKYLSARMSPALRVRELDLLGVRIASRNFVTGCLINAVTKPCS